MEPNQAIILLRNLIQRIDTREPGVGFLPGVLTDDEGAALQLAIEALEQKDAPSAPPPTPPEADIPQPDPPALPEDTAPERPDTEPPEPAAPAQPDVSTIRQPVEIDLGALALPPPAENARVCLDFGTAMSKATLVREDEEGEDISVLQLGVPGDQEEISETMLISSVYIDEGGKIWFGKKAVDLSMTEGTDGTRQRLDNIKRRLTEEGWSEQVNARFNPTKVPVTYGELVLAYITFFTWAVSVCLAELNYPRNIPRRFAVPSLSGRKGREAVHQLQRLVGEAQVLADTFKSKFANGIPLADFIDTVKQLRSEAHTYPYVKEDVSEPLGVAGSIISWKSRVDNLIMVVDVGAGTSDFGLYRMVFDPRRGNNTTREVEGSARVLTEAGNHLDRILIELIIRKSGLTSDAPMWKKVRDALEPEIRDLKETLFNDPDGFLFVALQNGVQVEIRREEFLQLGAVSRFAQSLKEKVIDILESVDSSFINWIVSDPRRRLVIALTGGGSRMPMVRDLAKGELMVNGMRVPVAPAVPFPKWLSEIDPNLEGDYPRIAVSLGGARRRLIRREDEMRTTSGGVAQPARLEVY